MKARQSSTRAGFFPGRKKHRAIRNETVTNCDEPHVRRSDAQEHQPSGAHCYLRIRTCLHQPSFLCRHSNLHTCPPTSTFNLSLAGAAPSRAHTRACLSHTRPPLAPPWCSSAPITATTICVVLRCIFYSAPLPIKRPHQRFAAACGSLQRVSL
jgi:hypothetical protein